MRHLRRALILLVTLSAFLAACSSGGTTASTGPTPTAAAPVTLNIFAAASLKESFTEMQTKYHAAHPNVTIKYDFDGSQILESQLVAGAPADVFASADQANMQKASTAGLVGPSQIFARNRLVVIVPLSNPAKIHTLKDLANQGVKLDVAAPTVPVGKYGLQVLDNLGKAPDYGQTYENSVKANFVSQETNVKDVVTKVELGEVDAGIVYRTDVTTDALKKVTEIDIPNNFNVIAQYPIAATKSSTHTMDAQNFEQYVLSPAGQAVLAKYHFLSPA